MKKKILMGALAIVLLATAGFGVNQSLKNDTDFSIVMLSNVEALAEGESSGKGCKLHLTSICETQHKDHYLYRNR